MIVESFFEDSRGDEEQDSTDSSSENNTTFGDEKRSQSFSSTSQTLNRELNSPCEPISRSHSNRSIDAGLNPDFSSVRGRLSCARDGAWNIIPTIESSTQEFVSLPVLRAGPWRRSEVEDRFLDSIPIESPIRRRSGLFCVLFDIHV